MRTVVIGFIAVLMLTVQLACSDEEKSSEKSGGPAPAKVEVQTIDKTSLVVRRTFLGEVQNSESTELAPGGSGSVTRVAVREGDEVKRGQLLVQLDDGILRARLGEVRAQLSRTEVELEQARRDAARLEALSREGHVTSVEAEQVTSRMTGLEAALQGEKAAVQRLREEISQMKVVAPVDGVVARRYVSPGQWVQTGEPAIELTSSGALEVHVRIPASVLELLSDEAEVEIHQDSDSVPGTIAGVVGALDSRTRTALLRVAPQESRTWLREGGTADVSIKLQRGEGGVVVSTDALVYGVSGTRVFRVRDDKAEPHPVTIVAQFEDQALLDAEKLAVGDMIVVRGNERLRPGQDVQVQQ